MSKITGLDKMSYKDLVNLKERVSAAIVARQAAEKVELKRKVEEMMHQSGFDVSELFGGRGGRKSGGKVAAKYRNPKDHSQTWTGRGRKPRWIADALAKGQKIENFLIG